MKMPVYTYMSFLAHIGAFFIFPFIIFSSWFSGGIYTPISHPIMLPIVATTTPPTSTSTPPTHTPPPSTTPAQNPVRLYSISQTNNVSPGTQISITGFGFTSSNKILLDGMVAASNVPITSSIAVACTTDPSCIGGIRQTLIFTVPSSIGPNCKAGEMCPMYLTRLLNGSYNLTVENENGTSNAIAITIVGAQGVPNSQ